MRHRAVRYATTTVSHVCQGTIKVAATLLVFIVCVMVVLRYFGVPVPSAEQLFRDAARIL
jgi:hypothetical protein